MSKFWDAYEEERNKLSRLPDADDDFIALERALINSNNKQEAYKSITGGLFGSSNSDVLYDYTRNL